MAESSLIEGKKVLLVDDEPDVLDTLEDLLSMCDVVKCTNYKAAKDYMENRQFDMAVLDIMGVEGYDLLDIAVLEDILQAKEQGKNPWTSWYGKMASFFEKKFGPNWQQNDKEFWEKFPFY